MKNTLLYVSDGEGFQANDGEQEFCFCNETMEYDIQIQRRPEEKRIYIIWDSPASVDKDDIILEELLQEDSDVFQILTYLLKFENLREGVFLNLRQVEFNGNDCTSVFQKNFIQYYFRNSGPLNGYSPLIWHLTNQEYAEAFSEYYIYLKEYYLQNEIYLYSAFSYGMPIDLRLALLLEIFEPMSKIIVDKKGLPKGSISNGHLQGRIDFCFKQYQKLFSKDDRALINQNLVKCVNTRNMIFHVDGSKEDVCSPSECSEMMDEFTILYRLIVMDLINMRIEPAYF